jgi:hypothetical protein
LESRLDGLLPKALFLSQLTDCKIFWGDSGRNDYLKRLEIIVGETQTRCSSPVDTISNLFLTRFLDRVRNEIRNKHYSIGVGQ